jgi:cytochrome b6
MGRIRSWFADRLELEAIREMARKKEVPQHRHTLWYYFGGMTLFLFLVQVATGILLLLYYRPSAAEAFESVQLIMSEVEFGWLVRSIHSWAANLMIGVLYIHMFSAMLLKAYRPPRELTWMTGFLLLAVALAFGFSGYLLPWTELSYFATKVGTEIAGNVPFVGDFLLKLLRGGDEVSGATLSRFYGLHVAILPAMATVLLGLHLYLVQARGMSVPISVQRSGNPIPTMKFFPNFLLRDAIGWVVAIGIVAALAALFPWELGEKADPFKPAPAGIKPEWFFMFMFQTLKYIPASIGPIPGPTLGVVLFGMGALFLFLLPFIDRRAARGEPSPLFTAISWTVVAYVILMTIVGYIA